MKGNNSNVVQFNIFRSLQILGGSYFATGTFYYTTKQIVNSCIPMTVKEKLGSI